VSGRDHVGRARIAALASGAAPAPSEARHLLACPRCRGELAAASPEAVLSLLAILPPGVPPPALPGLPVRHPGRGLARGMLAAVAAALLALLLVPLRAPATPAEADGGWVSAPGSLVATVEAPGARVVTYVPRDPNAPVVTLVLDQELDL